MNRTIRKETCELLLKMLGVNLNCLSEQTQADVRHISKTANNNVENRKEMIERANSLKHKQIQPFKPFNDMIRMIK